MLRTSDVMGHYRRFRLGETLETALQLLHESRPRWPCLVSHLCEAEQQSTTVVQAST